MKRKFEIPEMSNEEIANWYQTIKPIVEDDTYYRSYLRELSAKELTHVAFTWLDKPTDYADKVDYSKLALLEDRMMYLSFGYRGLFMPKVSEVIRQIPKEYLKKVVAFEIVDSTIGLDSKFSDAYKAACRVSIVRLYQAKDDTKQAAQPITEYPTSDSETPVGMTEEDFKELYVS